MHFDDVLLDEPRAARASALRRVLLTSVSLAAFAATSLTIGAVEPPPALDVVDLKLAEFAAHADECDTLFVGSSQVSHTIDPILFDRTTAKLGVATNSYNFGVPGVHAQELESLLERIVALRPRKLKLVVVAPDWIVTTTDPSQDRSARAAWWHTSAATWTATQALLAYERPRAWLDRIPHLARHWQSWFFHTTSAGRLREWIDDAAALDRDGRRSNAEPLVLGVRGFLPTDVACRIVHGPFRHEFENRQAELQLLRDDFDAQLADARKRDYLARPLPSFERAQAERLERLVRSTGATPVFLVPPVLLEKVDRGFVVRAAAAGVVEHLVDLNHADRHPELFRRELFFDTTHLNSEGARAVTLELASACASILAGR